jgi:molybdopterin synthase sulfur carrier subunit
MLVAMDADRDPRVAAGHLEVLLFGRLREIVGEPTLKVSTAGVGTVREVWGQVRHHHPCVSACASVSPALNEQFASWEESVRAGDRVAFLPPMSGG